MDGQRCDKCPAPARVKIDVLRTRGKLYFCWHHARQHFPLMDPDKVPSDPYPGMLFTVERVDHEASRA